MLINRGTEYAIRACLYLAQRHADAPLLLTDVAQGIGAPPNYLSNLLQALARFQIVQSHRGARRGYSLGRSASDISLLDVVEALEGPLGIACCTPGDESTCPLTTGCLVTELFRDLQDTMRKRLAAARLSTLVNRSARLGLPPLGKKTG